MIPVLGRIGLCIWPLQLSIMERGATYQKGVITNTGSVSCQAEGPWGRSPGEELSQLGQFKSLDFVKGLIKSKIMQVQDIGI